MRSFCGVYYNTGHTHNVFCDALLLAMRPQRVRVQGQPDQQMEHDGVVEHKGTEGFATKDKAPHVHRDFFGHGQLRVLGLLLLLLKLLERVQLLVIQFGVLALGGRVTKGQGHVRRSMPGRLGKDHHTYISRIRGKNRSLHMRFLYPR